MSDINACFISYRHTDDEDAHAFVQAFVRQLRKQLKWLLPNAPVFFDEEGIKIGDLFDEKLAVELCKSACMVIFFSPLHFDVHHPYCALEYRAMLSLEEQRLGQAVADLRNKGLIFPVVFRGLECLPQEIRSREYVNFDHIVVETDFEERKCQEHLKDLASQIYSRYVELINAGAFEAIDCQQFRFPNKMEIKEWLIKVSQIRVFNMPGH